MITLSILRRWRRRLEAVLEGLLAPEFVARTGAPDPPAPPPTHHFPRVG